MTTQPHPRIPAHAKKVWQGTIFTAWQWEQELFDGTKQIFEALTRPDTVCMLGVLPKQRILLVEDEQPQRAPILVPAGGRLEAGEDPEAGARREFFEETGYKVGHVKPWYTWQPSGKVFSTVHMFIGKDLILKGQAQDDGGERIILKEFTFDEFLLLGSDGRLNEPTLQIKLLEAQLDPVKRDKLEQLLFT